MPRRLFYKFIKEFSPAVSMEIMKLLDEHNKEATNVSKAALWNYIHNHSGVRLDSSGPKYQIKVYRATIVILWRRRF